jgi:hypothetical protein
MAHTSQQHSRPPEGVAIEFRHFRLVELFPLEDFEQMDEGLRALIPPRAGESPRLGEFAQRADELLGGSMTVVGSIVRSGEGFFLALGGRCMPGLPEEVRHISITAHKILPSLFAVTADVYLTDAATAHLKRLQEATYLPEVKFHSWNPRKWRHGWTENTPDAVAEEAVLSWIEDLRASVEVLLRPYVNGYFTSRFADSDPKLPAIESYCLINVPFGPAFREWRRGAARWWRSLGFGFVGIGCYESAHRMFSWNSTPRTKNMAARFCMPPDSESDTSEQPWRSYSFELDALLPAIAIQQLVDSLEADFNKVRRKAYQKLTSRRLFSRLGREIGTVQELSRRSLLLKRLTVEFEQTRPFIEHRCESFADMVNQASSPPQAFNVALLKDIEWRAEIVRQHVKLVTDAFTEHVAVLNIRATHRLQRLILWLTLVYTLAAIATVAAEWPRIAEFWAKMHGN